MTRCVEIDTHQPGDALEVNDANTFLSDADHS